jgi:hypothetical protein
MWLDNCTVTGLSASDQDRNAWAYLDGIGWRQIASNDNSIFYDLLSQLVAAKATGRPCNIYVNQGVITQIYVL